MIPGSPCNPSPSQSKPLRNVSELAAKLANQQGFREGLKRRAATEGRIGIFKNVFLGRQLLAKGFDYRKLAVGWAVLTHNLWVVARMAEAEKKRREDQKLKISHHPSSHGIIRSNSRIPAAIHRLPVIMPLPQVLLAPQWAAACSGPRKPGESFARREAFPGIHPPGAHKNARILVPDLCRSLLINNVPPRGG